jgi:CBS domain-containing protein
VQDIMEVNPVTIRIDAGLEEVLSLFLDNTNEHYYVVDAEGRLAGTISIHDVKDILHEEALGKVLIADDLCRPVTEAVHRLDNLEDCLIALGHRDTADLPVLYSPDHPVLVGIITRQAIFEIYNREVLQHRDTGIQLVTGEARMRDCVELPEEYKVQLLTPPDAWYGRSLRDLELRPNYGLSVLAVKHRDLLGGWSNRIPDPDRALEPGDRLIIVGEVRDLERLVVDLNPRAFPGGGTP